MKKIDPSSAPTGEGSRYPGDHAEPCRARRWLKLGDAAGLTQFGVNLVTLPPGAWSSQRHWHTHEDELVYVVEGELVLVTDAGEEVMRAGDAAGFKAGVPDGHHLQNRSDAPARFLVVGGRDDRDAGQYSDIDLQFLPGRYSGRGGYRRKDGSSY
ncbi:MAG TPA: cupin domain-containing protein [Kofleriaceae bacterium]|nr:cupin domain-containing protein [Kofleriaceae bacterium]